MMNNLAMEEINIIWKHQTNAPVDVVKIAYDFMINLYTAKEKKSLSGKIVKDPELGGESGYAIFVNAADSPLRQRFTIAHELSHFLLHKEVIGDGIVEDALYRSGLTNKQETEANKLAADILMPWRLIKAVMDSGIKTIPEFAEIFQVSESAMSIRMGIPC